MTRAKNPTIDLHDALTTGTTAAIKLWLRDVPNPRSRADEIAELSDTQIIQLADRLGPKTAAKLLDSLDIHTGADMLTVLAPVPAAAMLDTLEPDVATELLRELPEVRRRPVLAAMNAAESTVVRELLVWPQHSAAAHMTPGFISVRPTMTVTEAVVQIKDEAERASTISYVFVTEEDLLIGVVSYRELVLADGDDIISDLMVTDVVTVAPEEDQEVASELQWLHRLAAIPVVDHGKILGVITSDDSSDIARSEATEDAERQGGSAPLSMPYLRVSPWRLWSKRIVWLLVLFIAEAYTGTVLRAFEDVIQEVVVLSFFIPLLIGTGGNSGTQITTTLIRAMATGEVQLRDVFRVLRKELSTGMLVASTMALAAWIRAWTLGVGTEVGLVVTLSVAAIVLWATLIASVLPLILKKLRIDPAVVSGPLISTIVDGTGLLIYFMIAKTVLGL